MNSFLVFRERDNDIRLLLTEKGQPVPDLTPIMRITLEVGGVLLDSNQHAGVFNWHTDPTMLVLKLGAANIPEGEYMASLVVYALDHPNGLVWTEHLPITVRKNPQ